LSPADPRPAEPSFGEALQAWLRIALMSFGGPAAQIAVMHRVIVEERGWVDEKRFLNALNFCMLLPGPEAMQLVTYLGWMTHGVRGGITAGLLFILPGFLSILLLSYVYVLFGDVPAIEGLLFGLKAAVLAVVFVALDRLRRRVLHGGMQLAVALASFVGLFFLQLPFPLVIIAAAALGFWQARGQAPGVPAPAPLNGERPARTVATLLIGLLAWFGPLLLIAAALGPRHLLIELGLFFSQVAVLSFGGAYAVLAYVAQHAVEARSWLSPAEMVDGLGLAETTPGPLIQVLQFVAFLAAWRDAAPFGQMTAGLLASVAATWFTFAPCFLWIFLGAPWVERLLHQPLLGGAMAGVRAAVVGAVLNLSLWFALHVLFERVGQVHVGPVRLLVPAPGSLDPVAALLAAGALALLAWRGWGMLTVLCAAAVTGMAYALLFP